MLKRLQYISMHAIITQQHLLSSHHNSYTGARMSWCASYAHTVLSFAVRYADNCNTSQVLQCADGSDVGMQ